MIKIQSVRQVIHPDRRLQMLIGARKPSSSTPASALSARMKWQQSSQQRLLDR